MLPCICFEDIIKEAVIGKSRFEVFFVGDCDDALVGSESNVFEIDG